MNLWYVRVQQLCAEWQKLSMWPWSLHRPLGATAVKAEWLLLLLD